MTDIVERLRLRWEKREGAAARKISAILGEAKEAADEIERLRALATQDHQEGEVVENMEKIDGMLRKLEALRVAFDMKGANATTILRVVNTLSTMKGSLAAALAQQPLSVQEGWRPIAEADNGIAHIIDAAGLHIGNSLPIWARDIDGRVFECLWADDGKRAYWWDIEGESPVDPVEFMPHPLATLRDAKERKE